MKDCIFLPAENAQGCLVERARRFREHRPDLRPWERNPCENCKTGTARAEAAGPPKEEEVEKKERVLATITRKQPCTSTPILQCCTAVKAADLHQLTKELAAEGKIKIWTDGRKTIYTLPGAPDPFAGAEKKTAPAKKLSATPPSNSRAKSERPVSAPRKSAGNGAIVAVIADLEARRAKIDEAIETLRALA